MPCSRARLAWLLLLAFVPLAGCRRPTPAPPDNTPPGDTPPSGGEAPDAGPASTSSAEQPGSIAPEIRATDLSHVDPIELLSQAREVAQGHDPHVVLTTVLASHDVSGGTVDVTGQYGILYEYEAHYLDKSKPPGKDKVEKRLWVFARWGHFDVMELRTALVLRVLGTDHPKQEPRCSGRDAWEAAVRSGLPENAVGSMRWDLRSGAWDFRVPGHGELTRMVSASTCNIGGKSSPAGRASASPRPCGCAKGDLMCVMKCDQGRR